MKQINEMTKEDIKNISMIVFDVDGILVRRGSKIFSDHESLYIKYKYISPENIALMQQLIETKQFHINISSGRALYLLFMMFHSIIPTEASLGEYFSITYENGSATWHDGYKLQHAFHTHQLLLNIKKELGRIQTPLIKGFEPKEHIITIHCEQRVDEIESFIQNQYPQLYCIWNDEAYDIGYRSLQTKEEGLIDFCEDIEINVKNVMYIGDNYNDTGVSNVVGLTVTADPKRLRGDFFVPLDGEQLPATILMNKILELMK